MASSQTETAESNQKGSMIARYKGWVKANPGIVTNMDWLLYLTVYNPLRTRSTTPSESSEFTYEAYHAAVGLLSVWHQHIIEEDTSPVKRPTYSLWLDALEQTETLWELRAIHLERVKGLNRYGPLAVLEFAKSTLKMLMWSQYAGHLFLRHPGPEDIDQFEAEEGLRDILAALERLRERYTTLADAGGAAAAEARGMLNSTSQLVNSISGWISNKAAAARRGGSSAKLAAPVAAAAAEDADGDDDAAALPTLPEGLVDWGAMPALGAGASASGAAPAAPAAAADEDDILVRRRRSASGAAAAASTSGSSLSALGSSGSGVFTDYHMGMNLVWCGEMIHIWRPLLYVLLLKRYGRRSWRPWLGSLALDLLSMHYQKAGKALMRRSSMGLKTQQPSSSSFSAGAGGAGAADPVSGQGSQLHQAASAAGAGPQRSTSLLSVALFRGLAAQQWSPGEEAEIAERRKRLVLYLLRPPALDMLVRSPLEAVQRRLSRLPLVGAAADYALGLIDTFCGYYTYTSGSS